MATYEVRLIGEHAELGDVAAVDVARLIFDVQTAIARAAGAAIGRRPKATGRWEGPIEEATRLRLVGVTQGSVRISLQPPSEVAEDGQLNLEAASLADVGWATATRALEDVGDDEKDIDVLIRLLNLADHLSIGSRFEAVEFRTDGQLVARLDGASREALRSVVAVRRDTFDAPPAVAGILFEADFERRSAKVRTQEGAVVELLFEEGQADAIQEALRERSQFQGDVTFDPVTSSVKSVRLRRITRFEQLLLGAEGAQPFWRPVTFEELVERQGTKSVESFEDLRDTSLSDDEYRQFFDTLT